MSITIVDAKTIKYICFSQKKVVILHTVWNKYQLTILNLKDSNV